MNSGRMARVIGVVGKSSSDAIACAIDARSLLLISVDESLCRVTSPSSEPITATRKSSWVLGVVIFAPRRSTKVTN